MEVIPATTPAPTPTNAQDWMDTRKQAMRVYEWETSARKPTWMTTLAALIVSQLIWAEADTHEASICYATFAARCCCSYDSVSRTVTLLVKHEWVKRRMVTGKYRLSLTPAYLDHVAVKMERPPEAEAFVRWYRELQSKQATGVVSKYSLREMEPTNDERHHANAAEIIQKCGSVERAKAATAFAVKFKSKAIQTIYNLRIIICTQPSFMKEWSAFQKDGTKPSEPMLSKEQEEAKFKQLLLENRLASERWRMNRADKELEAASQAANDAAAHQAMRLGIAPDSFEFVKSGIYSPKKYQQIWETQYQKQQNGGAA
jgi:hypothetical protein